MRQSSYTATKPRMSQTPTTLRLSEAVGQTLTQTPEITNSAIASPMIGSHLPNKSQMISPSTVISLTYFCLGAVAVKSCSSRFEATGKSCFEFVVALNFYTAVARNC